MLTTLKTACLLVLSNIFMTYAWYGHLRDLKTKPWYIAAIVSWGIALFEYLLQVPANRIGATQLSYSQLKMMQEVITLAVFVPFSVFYLRERVRWDYLWAGVVCRKPPVKRGLGLLKKRKSVALPDWKEFRISSNAKERNSGRIIVHG